MSLKFRSLVGSAAVAGLVMAGAVAASSAAATGLQLESWSEGENAAPLDVVGGLVFHKGAQINFGHSLPGPNPAPFAEVDSISPLADVGGLSYTIAESTSWAPSFQLVVTADADDVTYARLVFEPYQQDPSAGPNIGEFMELEDGLWWANRVFVNGVGSSPFEGGAGSQASPQPLDFFVDYFGDAEIKAVSIQQGTSTESTSVLTSLTINGEDVVLGVADSTPYSQADLDAAVAESSELASKLAAATAQIAKLEAELKDVQGQNAATQAKNQELANALATAAKATDKASNQALKARALLPYKIAGKTKVGQTLRAKGKKFKGVSVSYQWRVGKKNAGKKATLKLKKRHAGKVVRLTVTKSYENAAGKTVNVKKTVRALKVDRVTR